MKAKKKFTIRLYLLLALAGLLILNLWPSLVTAMPLTARQQLERAWRFANDVGSFEYRPEVLQTTRYRTKQKRHRMF